MIDYLCYAGIYRDVWLKVTSSVSIKNLKIETPDALAERKQVSVRVDLSNAQGLDTEGTIRVTIADKTGVVLGAASAPVAGESTTLVVSGLSGLSLWDIDNPVLYTLTAELESAAGKDALSSTFGFRTANSRRTDSCSTVNP